MIMLRDDDSTAVTLVSCPLRAYWEQERFLYSWWAEYRSGRPPLSLLDTPQWIIEAMHVLDHIRHLEDQATNQSIWEQMRDRG